VSGVAHELTNVEMVLEGFASAVDDRMALKLPPEQEDVGELKRLQQRLARLNGQLRTLSRWEPDGASRIDVAATVDSALETLRAVGRLKYITVDARLEPGGAPVTAPRRLLTAALINLFSNIAEGLLEGPAPRRLEVALHVEAGLGILRIDARGYAFSQGLELTLFDPRHAAEGEGLRLVRRLLRAADGALSIDRTADSMHVTLALPLTPDPA
jgi:C4-dicarboxylate-specific signal transduction histidine kinase